MQRARGAVAILAANAMYVLLTGVLVVIGALAVIDIAVAGQPMLAWVTGVVAIVHVGAYWWHAQHTDARPWWAYQVVQLLLVALLILAGRVLADSPVTLAESALICLAGEALGVWGNTRRGFALAAAHLGAAAAVIVVMDGPGASGALISLGTTSVTLVVLIVLWNRESTLRDRAEALAVDLRASRDEVARLTLEAERRRMARELHDTLAQGLTGIALRLEAATEHLDRSRPERAGEIIREALLRARETLATSRGAIDGLRRLSDDLPDEIGRRAARFEAASGIGCDVELGGYRRLPSGELEQVLGVLDEALSNVMSHARATRVGVRFGSGAEGFFLEVADDGAGFDRDSVGEGHYGLVGMAERAALIGGRLNVSSRPGRTVVRLEKEQA